MRPVIAAFALALLPAVAAAESSGPQTMNLGLGRLDAPDDLDQSNLQLGALSPPSTHTLGALGVPGVAHGVPGVAHGAPSASALVAPPPPEEIPQARGVVQVIAPTFAVPSGEPVPPSPDVLLPAPTPGAMLPPPPIVIYSN